MPKITDPGEMEIIRKSYFEPPTVRNSDLDPEERNDRLLRKQTRNIAR